MNLKYRVRFTFTGKTNCTHSRKKLKPFFAFSYTFSIFSRILNVYPVANFGFWAKMCPKFFGRPKKNKNRGVRPITHTKYFWIWSWHILLLRQSSAFMRLVRVCLQWIQRGNGSVSKLPKKEKLAHGPGLGSQFFWAGTLINLSYLVSPIIRSSRYKHHPRWTPSLSRCSNLYTQQVTILYFWRRT